jgi:hypothetical protein
MKPVKSSKPVETLRPVKPLKPFKPVKQSRLCKPESRLPVDQNNQRAVFAANMDTIRHEKPVRLLMPSPGCSIQESCRIH